MAMETDYKPPPIDPGYEPPHIPEKPHTLFGVLQPSSPHPPETYHEPEAYHPPEPTYHEPEPFHHAPKPSFNKPKPDYHSPKPTYIEPKPLYHEPTQSHPEPKPSYYEPEPVYNAPKPTYHEPELKEYHSEPLYYPGKDLSIAVIAVNHSNKNSKYSDSQKELGKVLEELKNRSVVYLFQNGGKFELSGPYYVVTPTPLQSVSIHK